MAAGKKPIRREIRGKDYVLVVLRVHSWDALGRPASVEVGYDDSRFDLRDDLVSREFMMAWVPAIMAEPDPKKRGHCERLQGGTA